MFGGQAAGAKPKKRFRRADISKAAKTNAIALKTASAAQLFFPRSTPEAFNMGEAHGEVSSYDASGSKHERTEKEFTATMEPSRKKNRQSGKCKACLTTGVPGTFLIARKHERKVPKKCREVQETWMREQPATPAGMTVVLAATFALRKKPRGAAGGEVMSSIGTTAAAQANIARGSTGKQSKAPSSATDAGQAKIPRRWHGEAANAPNGAAAAVQAIGPNGSDEGKVKAPRSAAAVAQEDVLGEAAVASTLSRSGRVRKRKIPADM